MKKPIGTAIVFGVGVVTLVGGETIESKKLVHAVPINRYIIERRADADIPKQSHENRERYFPAQKPAFTITASGGSVSSKVLTSSGFVFMLPSGPVTRP